MVEAEKMISALKGKSLANEWGIDKNGELDKQVKAETARADNYEKTSKDLKAANDKLEGEEKKNPLKRYRKGEGT